jgi:mono/diheme cytochrome c family protein
VEIAMIFFTKSILALILTGLAVLNVVVMLELLGRTDEKRFNPKRLRQLHRVNGYLFILLFLFISYLCIKIMRGMGQDLPPRAALHGLMAVATFFLLCLKIILIRFYKKYYTMALPMGLGVFLLLLTTTATSAGYYFAMRGVSSFQITADLKEELAREGATLFNERGCADCHYADRTEAKIGPGLKGLFKRDKLPVSGRVVTEDTVRKQLKTPFRGMPAFEDLPEDKVKALLAFLKTL